MDEQQRWSCDCGYSAAMAAGDEMADLRAWARHVRDAHGEAALDDIIKRELGARVEELRHEGKVLHDPFDGHDYWVGEPPKSGPR